MREVSKDCPFADHRVPMARAPHTACRRPPDRLPRIRRRTISRSMPMLISPAYAQSTGMSGLMDQSALIQFLPLALIFVVFYFLLIRPQQQKQKQHKTMVDALRRGDRIVTGGGILATVSKVIGPEEVEVDIASGVRIRVLRSTISSVLAKPDPAAAREAARERDRESAKADKA